MHFDSEAAVRSLIALALAEDGVDSDVTTLALVPPQQRATARIIARKEGVLAGLRLLREGGPLRAALGETVEVSVLREDGSPVLPGQEIARLRGSARRLLSFERTILNLLQRMSGIATMTARFVTAAGSGGPAILETRKTCPGFRVLDKEAVRFGGGQNHRMGLHDMVLIKENHLACVPAVDRLEAVRRAVILARSEAPGLAVEIEVESLAEFHAALDVHPDIIMLDDFDDADIKLAVDHVRTLERRPLLEVSGGVTLERIPRLSALGVDRISAGALTHSVTALDLSIDLQIEAIAP